MSHKNCGTCTNFYTTDRKHGCKALDAVHGDFTSFVGIFFTVEKNTVADNCTHYKENKNRLTFKSAEIENIKVFEKHVNVKINNSTFSIPKNLTDILIDGEIK